MVEGQGNKDEEFAVFSNDLVFELSLVFGLNEWIQWHDDRIAVFQEAFKFVDVTPSMIQQPHDIPHTDITAVQYEYILHRS